MKSHPYHVIKALAERRPGLEFCFGTYLYDPETKIYTRTTLKVSGSELASQVPALLWALLPGEELALQSEVLASHYNPDSLAILDTKYHIPMIDFSAESLEDCQKGVDEIFGVEFRETLRFYSSGRSFHAYGQELMDEAQWYQFMGNLLLMNAKGTAEPVDPRWVGHRLVDGYGSLRWSNNSGRYKALPTLVT